MLCCFVLGGNNKYHCVL